MPSYVIHWALTDERHCEEVRLNVGKDKEVMSAVSAEKAQNGVLKRASL